MDMLGKSLNKQMNQTSKQTNTALGLEQPLTHIRWPPWQLPLIHSANCAFRPVQSNDWVCVKMMTNSIMRRCLIQFLGIHCWQHELLATIELTYRDLYPLTSTSLLDTSGHQPATTFLSHWPSQQTKRESIT